jgi:Holliday junction resolvase RusA-like endonuclease
MNATAPITFFVPGLPVAQPRHRTRIASNGGRMLAMAYTPTNSPVNAFKAAVRLAAASACQGAPLDGPVAMTLEFCFPRPKSKRWKTRPMPRLRHTSKPDCDNLAKSVCDALTGLVFGDDAQVCDLGVAKWIAAGDEAAGTRVVLWPIEEEE